MSIYDCFILALALFVVAFGHATLLMALAVAFLAMFLVRLIELLQARGVKAGAR